ncbi:MAG: phage portal protein [Planctomycetia bacterium]|nr:phage portal protein [Planctomycetia bacterium]
MTQRPSTNNTGLLDQLHHRLAEACGDLWDSFVDPREPYFDDGGAWAPLAGGGGGPYAGDALPQTEDQLRDLRHRCRRLAATNEFAINGHENRISYIVGAGHTYRATAHKSAAASPTLALDVQRVLDQFITDSRWHHRQQEIVRRRDRDGEAFLRFFVAEDGRTQVRFVDPDEVCTPMELRDNPAARFGVLTEPDDVETPLAYFIDGRPVDAADVQHRRANVDDNVRRGLPLFYPVEKNLRRAEKLLRNMSTVAEIQAAIALIRKHTGASGATVQRFVSDGADATSSSPASGATRHLRHYAPGTILDAPAGLDYDFPAAGLDAGNFVTVLQAELRAVASRLVMPEFMLTSDASNSNYASTLVAEGPAMRLFARLQAEMIADDLAVMWRVVRNAVAAGTLAREALTDIEIQASPPSLSTRDPRVEAEVNQIEFQNGVLSPQTWCLRDGLDYDQEQQNLAAWRGGK